MQPLRNLWFIVPLLIAVPVLAQSATRQGTTSNNTTQSQRTVGGSRGAVAIQLATNNPFQNPIGQALLPLQMPTATGTAT